MTRTSKICHGCFRRRAWRERCVAKIKTFTNKPRDVAAYGPVSTEDGARSFALKIVREAGDGVVIATAPEIRSREDAKALSGTKLFIARDALPAVDDEDDYYLEDLVGLSAVGEDGEPLGVVSAVYDFGAGDVIELASIPGVRGRHLAPFTKQAIPEIDIAAGRIVIAAAFKPKPGEARRQRRGVKSPRSSGADGV